MTPLHRLYHLLGPQLTVYSGLAALTASGPRPVFWQDERLHPEELYCGLIRAPEAVSCVLQRRLFCGPCEQKTTALLIDAAGVADSALSSFDETWRLSLDAPQLVESLLLSAAFGGFDVVVVILDTFVARSEHTAACDGVLSLRQKVAAAPWIVLGVGLTGYQDPMLAALRARGVPLKAMEERQPG